MVPSTWPIRLRVVVPPSTAGADDLKPGCIQRTRASVERSLVSMRMVWARVTALSLPTCRSRSVCDQASSSWSVSKAGISGSWSGMASACPVRVNSGRPRPTLMVRPSGWAASSASVSPSAGSPAMRRAASSLTSRSTASAFDGVGSIEVEADERLQQGRRRLDPRLVLAVEVERGGSGGRGRGRRGAGCTVRCWRRRGCRLVALADTEGVPAGGAEDRGAAGGQHAPPGDRGVAVRHRIAYIPDM